MKIEKTKIKWLIFILIVILGIAASALLAEKINPYVRWLGNYGYLGILVGAFAGNATIVFPAPFLSFILPLAVTLASQNNLVLVVLIYALGATGGEMMGYILGRGGKHILNKDDEWLHRKAEKWLARYGSWAIMVLTFQPIFPFDIVGIVAGTLRYPWWKFFIFCFLGRVPKYLFLISGGFELLKLLERIF